MSWPPANGLMVGLEFKSGWVRPSGLQAALPFGTTAGPVNPDSYISVGSWDSFIAGNHTLTLFEQSLLFFGWSSHTFGLHALSNNARLIHPWGWQDSAFPRPLVRSDRQGVHPSGIRAPDVPEPFISLLTREIFAGNIPPLNQWGKPLLEWRNKDITPAGINAQAFGAHWLSVHRRRMEPAGLNATLWGRPWVSHGAREIQPREWDSQALGRPRVSPSQIIYVDGFEATGWGERITPAPQHVLPAYILPPDVPWPTVFNYVQRIWPVSFQSNVQEHWRYGQAHFYNQTQYVQVVDDGEGGMAGEFPTVWTEVTNRNREINTYGPDTARFGDALLELNARLLEPPGTDMTQWGDAFIAHDKQPIHFEGWDSLSLSRWHSVVNKADAIVPDGADTSAFGLHEIADRTQTIKWPGHFDSSEFGRPWLDDAERRLEMGGLGVEPPQINLPTLHLHTRYIDLRGWDSQMFGGSWWQERFNIISPRWSHYADRIGEPALRNLTPELHFFGYEQTEWGDTFLRHQFRPLGVFGDDMARFGQHRIGDRQQKLTAPGFHALLTSEKTRIFNVYEPPPDPTQFIRPDGMYIPDSDAVPRPMLNVRSISPQGWDSRRMGTPSVDDNAVVPDSLEDTQEFGVPWFSNSIRQLLVGEFPKDEVFEPPIPDLKPRTIWVGYGAPAQATRIHPPLDDPKPPSTGAVIGSHRIANKTPPPLQFRGENQQAFGNATLTNARQYIELTGLRSYRSGWHYVIGGDLLLEQYEATDTMAVGRHTLAFINSLQRILPRGLDSAEFGRHTLESFHRELSIRGWDSLLMGESGYSPRYMQQRLWIGEPDWPPFEGADMAEIGDAWISHAVREVKPEGWDALRMDYEAGGYRTRMRVVRGAAGATARPAAQVIQVNASDSEASSVGLPNVDRRLQAIYPDGATDMFRKGGNWWPA